MSYIPPTNLHGYQALRTRPSSDITIRFPNIVHIALFTLVLGHLSTKDIELARAIPEIAITHATRIAAAFGSGGLMVNESPARS